MLNFGIQAKQRTNRFITVSFKTHTKVAIVYPIPCRGSYSHGSAALTSWTAAFGSATSTISLSKRSSFKSMTTVFSGVVNVPKDLIPVLIESPHGDHSRDTGPGESQTVPPATCDAEICPDCGDMLRGDFEPLKAHNRSAPVTCKIR